MIGLDTNILVRYLVRDDPDQAKRAKQCIQRADRCFINAIVLCELVWVLSGAYALSRTDIAGVIEKLLMTREFEIEDSQITWTALADFRASKADWADCVIGRRNAVRGCTETASFDKAAHGAHQFRLI